MRGQMGAVGRLADSYSHLTYQTVQPPRGRRPGLTKAKESVERCWPMRRPNVDHCRPQQGLTQVSNNLVWLVLELERDRKLDPIGLDQTIVADRQVEGRHLTNT